MSHSAVWVGVYERKRDDRVAASGPVAGRFARRPQCLFGRGDRLGCGSPPAQVLGIAARALGELGGDRLRRLGVVEVAQAFLQILQRRDEALAPRELRLLRRKAGEEFRRIAQLLDVQPQAVAGD